MENILAKVTTKHYIVLYDRSKDPILNGTPWPDYFTKRSSEISDEDLKDSKFFERFLKESTFKCVVFDRYAVEIGDEVLMCKVRNERNYYFGEEYSLEEIKKYFPRLHIEGGEYLSSLMSDCGCKRAVRYEDTREFDLVHEGDVVIKAKP